MNTRNRLTKTILFLGDAVFLYAALLLGIIIRYGPEHDWQPRIGQHFRPFSIVFFSWLLAFAASGLYDLRFIKNSRYFLYRLLRVMATNTVIAILFFYLLSTTIEPRASLAVIVSLATLFIFLWRYLFNLLIIRAGASRILFLGLNDEAITLADYLAANPQLGQKPIAFMSVDGTTPQGILSLPCFSAPRDLPHIVSDFNIDTIVTLRQIKEDKALIAMLLKTIAQGVMVREFPTFHEMVTGKIPHSLIEEVWFLENLIGVRKRSYELAKRAIDLALAALLSIPWLIIFPFAALAIRINSKGQIFFRQKRVGRNGKIFEIIKFRSTYRTSVPDNHGWQKEENVGVYTKVGKFLRKSYLDELPQIINIFRGEMSFVGPRPERPEFVTRLDEQTPFYETRLLVPPGITGWAQINMENDAAVEDAPEKMQYDLYYIKNRSLLLDLLIMLRTIATMLRRQGR